MENVHNQGKFLKHRIEFLLNKLLDNYDKCDTAINSLYGDIKAYIISDFDKVYLDSFNESFNGIKNISNTSFFENRHNFLLKTIIRKEKIEKRVKYMVDLENAYFNQEIAINILGNKPGINDLFNQLIGVDILPKESPNFANVFRIKYSEKREMKLTNQIDTLDWNSGKVYTKNQELEVPLENKKVLHNLDNNSLLKYKDIKVFYPISFLNTYTLLVHNSDPSQQITPIIDDYNNYIFCFDMNNYNEKMQEMLRGISSSFREIDKNKSQIENFFDKRPSKKPNAFFVLEGDQRTENRQLVKLLNQNWHFEIDEDNDLIRLPTKTREKYPQQTLDKMITSIQTQIKQIMRKKMKKIFHFLFKILQPMEEIHSQRIKEILHFKDRAIEHSNDYAQLIERLTKTKNRTVDNLKTNLSIFRREILLQFFNHLYTPETQGLSNLIRLISNYREKLITQNSITKKNIENLVWNLIIQEWQNWSNAEQIKSIIQEKFRNLFDESKNATNNLFCPFDDENNEIEMLDVKKILAYLDKPENVDEINQEGRMEKAMIIGMAVVMLPVISVAMTFFSPAILFKYVDNKIEDNRYFKNFSRGEHDKTIAQGLSESIVNCIAKLKHEIENPLDLNQELCTVEVSKKLKELEAIFDEMIRKEVEHKQKLDKFIEDMNKLFEKNLEHSQCVNKCFSKYTWWHFRVLEDAAISFNLSGIEHDIVREKKIIDQRENFWKQNEYLLLPDELEKSKILFKTENTTLYRNSYINNELLMLKNKQWTEESARNLQKELDFLKLPLHHPHICKASQYIYLEHQNLIIFLVNNVECTLMEFLEAQLNSPKYHLAKCDQLEINCEPALEFNLQLANQIGSALLFVASFDHMYAPDLCLDTILICEITNNKFQFQLSNVCHYSYDKYPNTTGCEKMSSYQTILKHVFAFGLSSADHENLCVNNKKIDNYLRMIENCNKVTMEEFLESIVGFTNFFQQND